MTQLPVETSCQNGHRNRPGAQAGTLCAYCLDKVLTGSERPEHPLPAAIRASIRVSTACDPCNDWAGEHVDGPFLDDPFIRELRAAHDVRDPRHPDRRVRSPFGHGFTADGVHIATDDDWKPRMTSGRIVDRGEGRFDVIARDRAEADRLLARVRARAEAEGKQVEFGDFRVVEDRPRVSGRLEVRPWRWRRAFAKAALALASDVYDAGWREGEDAAQLRLWMRDAKALPHDHCPMRPVAGTVFGQAVPAPACGAWFSKHGDTTLISIVLLGEYLVSLPVDRSGRDVPTRAWLTDPTRPTGDPRLTYAEVASGWAAEQIGLRGEVGDAEATERP
jgi:hypothetical protein